MNIGAELYMAEIITAANAGFCPGVRSAVSTVEKLIEGKRDDVSIYTFGALIHNTGVVERLSASGVRIISEEDIDGIFATSDKDHKSVVVVRAHGIPKKTSEKLAKCAAGSEDFTICDRTCVFVKRIHEIVDRETSDGSTLLVIGDINHAEISGIVSYAHAQVVVAGDFEELKLCKLPNNPLVMVAQTTLSLSEWNKCKNFIKNLCTNAKIFDTICSMTEKRQTEADELSKQVDLMFVIGSAHSSNTMKLYAICKANQPNTHLIGNASEIDPAIVAKAKRIGITAGASTPSDIIEEAKTTMNEEIKTSEENFEELLEDSLKTLNTGDVVTGVITSISSTEIHVDLSANVTGVLPISEAVVDPSESVEDKYKVGDEITAFVVRVSDIEGVAGLSRKRIERITDWKFVNDAKESGEILEGKVTDVVKGGVMIQYKTVKLFVPASQTGVPKDGDMSALLGQTVKFVIIEVDNGRNRAVASIRAVLRKERKEGDNGVEEGYLRYYLGVGRRDHVTPKDIVGAIAGEGYISSSNIGRIKLFDKFSTVELPETMPQEVLDILADMTIRGNESRFRLMTDEPPTGPAPGTRPRASREDRRSFHRDGDRRGKKFDDKPFENRKARREKMFGDKKFGKKEDRFHKDHDERSFGDKPFRKTRRFGRV